MFVTACASSSSNTVSTDTSSTVKPAETSGYKTLDQAIKEAAGRIDEQIEARTKIAILNINSSSDQFSLYVIDELTANFLDTRKLTVIDRKEIDLIRGELDFQLSGEVSDDSMQELGKILGAQTIVSGSLMEIGDTYRLVIRALSVQTATVEVQYRTDIANDNRVRALLAAGKSANTGNVSVSSRPNPRAPAVSQPSPTVQTNTQTAPPPVPVAPPKPGTVWNGNGHSYEVINQTMPWANARRYCEERGGYLATVTSSGEQVFIENLLARDGNKIFYWLGGYRGNNRSFQWVTGERFEYTNWMPGEPNNYFGDEDYLQILRTAHPNVSSSRLGQWNDANHSGSGQHEPGFICEWD
jgi:TolB-like protein